MLLRNGGFGRIALTQTPSVGKHALALAPRYRTSGKGEFPKNCAKHDAVALLSQPMLPHFDGVERQPKGGRSPTKPPVERSCCNANDGRGTVGAEIYAAVDLQDSLQGEPHSFVRGRTIAAFSSAGNTLSDGRFVEEVHLQR